MSMYQILNVLDFFKREGKIRVNSLFSNHFTTTNILLMGHLKLTTCDFYDKMDGVKYFGQYEKYMTINVRGVIFK